MSLIDKVYNNIEGVFAWISMALKQNVLSYCSLEASDDQTTLVANDGSLVSIIKLEGYRRFVGNNEFVFLTEKMTEMLQSCFISDGHFIQVLFSYDQENIETSIHGALGSAIQTAKKISVEMDDIFESRIKTLSSFCSDEACYMAVWTTPQAISKTQIKQMYKEHMGNIGKGKLPKLKNVQNMMLVLPELRDIHKSVVSTIIEDMGQLGYFVDAMDVHSAVRHVRQTVDPDVTASDWTPHLPGDRLTFKVDPNDKTLDLSEVLWKPLPGQIIPRESEEISLKIARVGDRLYAPLFIELFPKDVKPFYELFRRLLPSKMPWRISYTIAPGGINVTKSKTTLAKFLAFSSNFNRMIIDSHALLTQINERSDNPVIRLVVGLCTWAGVDEQDLLRERISKLVKITQSWGGCETRQVTGDVVGATFFSSLGLSKRPIAAATAAPLSAAVKMLPIVRQASSWEKGALLFRTPDGKLWPYQPGSSQQVSWIDIIFARSGSGKSVLLNAMNLGVCLSPGLSELPNVSIIDIGPSSKGLVSLIREGLPPHKKHQALYHRLQLSDDDAINAFDTQLGARFPTKAHRSFLINFLSLLMVDDISSSPVEGASSMLSMIIDQTYARYEDDKQPKKYVAYLEPEVEKALKEIGFEPTESTTWWQVTDILFKSDNIVAAMKAQRQAVPTISDTIAVAHNSAIKDLFGEVKTATGEDYITYYCRIISAVIKNFPTLTSVTRLNIEGARIVAMDLDEVAKTGSASADKQTAVLYMLCRHVMGQHYFLNDQAVAKFPKDYRAYHTKRVKKIMEEPKRIVFDEFHRTSKSKAVRDQVLQDMREGRKWKIQISLASQSVNDFDPLMVEFATAIFILDAGPAKTVDETCKLFGLTETEKLALTTRVHGPSSKGATFIAQFVTKKGLNTQLLTSTISAVELWAFNTTTEDVYIREKLYEIIGPMNARKFLAKRFPGGSATGDIGAALKMSNKATVSEICDKFIEDISAEYRLQKMKLSVEDKFLDQFDIGEED